jgi:hypothetical protein
VGEMVEIMIQLICGNNKYNRDKGYRRLLEKKGNEEKLEEEERHKKKRKWPNFMI